MKLLAVSLAGFLMSAVTSWAVGFQTASIPDAGYPPLQAAIWYPSDASAIPRPLEGFTQVVALDGPVSGQDLPLVLISHGSGGWLGGHYDTALALAQAGFVVVAVTHTSDNYRDHSGAGTVQNFVSRVRHISDALDWALAASPVHDRVNPSRIGVFGFSAGGTTALLLSGGDLEMTRMVSHCREAPADPQCRNIPKALLDGSIPVLPDATLWHSDPRIRAAVVAAPFAAPFTPESIAAIEIPIQLWRGAEDEVVPNPWHAEVIHRALTIGHEYHVVPNAGHYAFFAPCTETQRQHVPEICADPPGFDRAAFHEELNRAIIAFFREKLRAVSPSATPVDPQRQPAR